MLALLLQEAARREIFVEPRSLAIAKRGVCTFVNKATTLQNAGANLALIVNNGENFRVILLLLFVSSYGYLFDLTRNHKY